MRNSRLGCLTFTGILAALVTALAIGGVAFAQGGVLYSPGALNAQAGEPLGGVASHAETGGECAACHTAPWSRETMADRCVSCHADVGAQMREAASLHGSISRNNPNLKCAYCHPEHRGPNAPLTVAAAADFPHDALGFSLKGHRLTVTREAFVCSDCHSQSVTTFDPLDCQTCHQQMDAVFAQAHAINYGTDCLACHDGVDRFGKTFSHDGFPFRLEGKHAQVNCVHCHAGARAAADFAMAPTDCFSCHRQDDPHAGRFGSDCAACHTPAAWEPALFDHNLAAFKLEGEHAEADCNDCHKNNIYKGTPSDCYSCHARDDKHNGRFGTDCAACHTPNDWDDATVDHQRFAFKLEGAHQQVECEACHQNGVFKGTPSDCYSCHARDDEHNGRFGTDCAACHTPSNWENAAFDHSRSNFPLTGSHQRINCERCHVNGQFAGTPSACAACHADPSFHAGAFGAQCQSCHSTVSWSPAIFDLPHPQPAVDEHGSGIFHGGTTCRTCHPSTVYVYTCLSCHSDNQGGEGGEGGGDD